MRNARLSRAGLIAGIVLGSAALGGCHKQAAQNRGDNEISIDDNLGQTTSQLPANADIETLPADESSTTPSNQLQTGYDNPDVNNLGNSH